jgi:hypothetical protein
MLGSFNITKDVQIKFSYLEVGSSLYGGGNECKHNLLFYLILIDT